MLELNSLPVSETVYKLFYERDIVEPFTVTRTMERYKFLSRSRILELLREIDPSKDFVDVKEIVRPEPGTKLYSDVERVETRHGVIIDVADETSPTVYVPIECRSSMESLSLALPFPLYELRWITQCNYEELLGVIFTDWDYLLLYNRIVIEALEMSATDIHIGVKHVDKKPVFTCEFRVNNDMVSVDLFDFTAEMNHRIISVLLERKTPANTLDLDKPVGITTSAPDLFGDGDIALRLTAHKIYGGYHSVARIQRMSTVSFKIPELGFKEDVQNDLYKLVTKRGGLTLITGMIRSGKNGTAFAIGNEIQETARSILDWSSPIETLMGFPQADYGGIPEILEHKIRLTKKLDADVVFLNEIPNKKIAAGVLDLVNSGVHVITTTHLNRIWQLPYKLYEYYDDDYKNILTHLNICMNQRMFIKQCTRCTNKAFVAELPQQYRNILEPFGVKQYYTNYGCEYCRDGNQKNGLQPYVERVVFTDELRSELLKMEKPYEMEALLKDYVRKNNLTFEYALSEAVGLGKVQPKLLDSIL